MKIRKIRARVAMTLLAALLTAVGLAAPAASAPGTPGVPGAPAQEECDPEQGGDGSGTHVGVGCGDENPDDPGGPGNGGNGGGGGGIDAEAECAEHFPNWADCVAVVNLNGVHPTRICGYVVAPFQDLLDYYHPERPEGYDTLLYFICPRDGGPFYTEDTQAVQGGGPPPPPDPEEVAEDLWVEVQATLLQPALETWPPANMSSVLHLPSFVAVANWQGEVPDHDCQLGTCVDLLATPALTFTPGDGADPVACEPGGTTFDRYGAEPDDQAGGDACAHVYELRTGVDDRPDTWPGVVSITWTVTWQEDGGANESGAFDPLVLSTALPRAVTEWVSVLTNVAPRGGAER